MFYINIFFSPDINLKDNCFCFFFLSLPFSNFLFKSIGDFCICEMLRTLSIGSRCNVF